MDLHLLNLTLHMNTLLLNPVCRSVPQLNTVNIPSHGGDLRLSVVALAVSIGHRSIVGGDKDSITISLQFRNFIDNGTKENFSLFHLQFDTLCFLL